MPIETKTDPSGRTYYHDTDSGRTAWTREELAPTPNFKIQSQSHKALAGVEKGPLKRQGEWVWVPDPELCFQPAKVLAEFALGEMGRVQLENNAELTLDPVKSSKCMAMDPQSLAGIDNMVLLNVLNEAALLHNVRKRFFEDKIYTTVGDILVAINPFARLPLYSEQIREKYMHDSSIQPPHVYTIADNAYRALLQNHKSQAVCIAGESGAGKTETMKLVLQYLAEVTPEPGKRLQTSQGSVNEQILQTNPVTEAFGNAKTVRNNNSSRFGKWTALSFSPAGGILGAFITDYLLEKSRVGFQANGERNYHSFYFMLQALHASRSSSDAALKETIGRLQLEELKLQPLEAHRYVNQTEAMVNGIDDVEEFKILVDAFDGLGVPHEHQICVFKLLGAVLHLGNIGFDAKGDEAGFADESAKVSTASSADLAHICALLGLDVAGLSTALTSRQMGIVGRSVTVVPYKLDQAAATLDALAKQLYGSLFTWLISAINTSLSGGAGGSGGEQKRKSMRRTSMITPGGRDANGGLVIGILDIFGFEIFVCNSFEQLCINFCNEKLQHHFNNHIFRVEQEYYRSEGVEVKAVDFKNNEPTLMLLEGPGGVFGLIDDEVKVGSRGSDEKFLQKLLQSHAKHPNLARCNTVTADCLNPDVSFGIIHFAGEVKYEVTNFLEKNRDKLPDNLAQCVKSSSDPFLQKLGATFGGGEEGGSAPSPRKGRGRGGKKAQTLGGKFKSQLGELMKTLNNCEPQFIRCIKPNHAKKSRIFTSDMSLQQIKCAGLLEVCRVRQIGYPQRSSFESFLQRYACCAPGKAGGGGGGAPGCKALLDDLEKTSRLDPGLCAVGHTRVFLKSSCVVQLEEARSAALFDHIALLQNRLIRGPYCRARYAQYLARLDDVEKSMFLCDAGEMKRALEKCKAENGKDDRHGGALPKSGLPFGGAKHVKVRRTRAVMNILKTPALAKLLEGLGGGADGGSGAKMSKETLAPVVNALKNCKDPELPVEIVDELGDSLGGLVERKRALAMMKDLLLLGVVEDEGEGEGGVGGEGEAGDMDGSTVGAKVLNRKASTMTTLRFSSQHTKLTIHDLPKLRKTVAAAQEAEVSGSYLEEPRKLLEKLEEEMALVQTLQTAVADVHSIEAEAAAGAQRTKLAAQGRRKSMVKLEKTKDAKGKEEPAHPKLLRQADSRFSQEQRHAHNAALGHVRKALAAVNEKVDARVRKGEAKSITDDPIKPGRKRSMRKRVSLGRASASGANMAALNLPGLMAQAEKLLKEWQKEVDDCVQRIKAGVAKYGRERVAAEAALEAAEEDADAHGTKHWQDLVDTAALRELVDEAVEELGLVGPEKEGAEGEGGALTAEDEQFFEDQIELGDEVTKVDEEEVENGAKVAVKAARAAIKAEAVLKDAQEQECLTIVRGAMKQNTVEGLERGVRAIAGLGWMHGHPDVRKCRAMVAKAMRKRVLLDLKSALASRSLLQLRSAVQQAHLFHLELTHPRLRRAAQMEKVLLRELLWGLFTRRSAEAMERAVRSEAQVRGQSHVKGRSHGHSAVLNVNTLNPEVMPRATLMVLLRDVGVVEKRGQKPAGGLDGEGFDSEASESEEEEEDDDDDDDDEHVGKQLITSPLHVAEVEEMLEVHVQVDRSNEGSIEQHTDSKLQRVTWSSFESVLRTIAFRLQGQLLKNTEPESDGEDDDERKGEDEERDEEEDEKEEAQPAVEPTDDDEDDDAQQQDDEVNMSPAEQAFDVLIAEVVLPRAHHASKQRARLEAIALRYRDGGSNGQEDEDSDEDGFERGYNGKMLDSTRNWSQFQQKQRGAGDGYDGFGFAHEDWQVSTRTRFHVMVKAVSAERHMKELQFSMGDLLKTVFETFAECPTPTERGVADDSQLSVSQRRRPQNNPQTGEDDFLNSTLKPSSASSKKGPHSHSHSHSHAHATAPSSRSLALESGTGTGRHGQRSPRHAQGLGGGADSKGKGKGKGKSKSRGNDSKGERESNSAAAGSASTSASLVPRSPRKTLVRSGGQWVERSVAEQPPPPAGAKSSSSNSNRNRSVSPRRTRGRESGRANNRSVSPRHRGREAGNNRSVSPRGGADRCRQSQSQSQIQSQSQNRGTRSKSPRSRGRGRRDADEPPPPAASSSSSSSSTGTSTGTSTSSKKKKLKEKKARHARRHDIHPQRQSLHFGGLVRFASTFLLLHKDPYQKKTAQRSGHVGRDTTHGTKEAERIAPRTKQFNFSQLSQLFMDAIGVQEQDTVGGLTFEEFWEVLVRMGMHGHALDPDSEDSNNSSNGGGDSSDDNNKAAQSKAAQGNGYGNGKAGTMTAAAARRAARQKAPKSVRTMLAFVTALCDNVRLNMSLANRTIWRTCVTLVHLCKQLSEAAEAEADPSAQQGDEHPEEYEYHEKGQSFGSSPTSRRNMRKSLGVVHSTSTDPDTVRAQVAKLYHTWCDRSQRGKMTRALLVKFGRDTGLVDGRALRADKIGAIFDAVQLSGKKELSVGRFEEALRRMSNLKSMPYEKLVGMALRATDNITSPHWDDAN